MTAPAPADIVTELKSAFADYQIFEKRGLAFGQRLYELRAKSSAQGNHSGTGFLPLLQQAGIPQRTAYYWIHSYEISIGERVAVEKRKSDWSGVRDCTQRGNTPNDINSFGGSRRDGYFSHEYIGHPPEGSGISEALWGEMTHEQRADARYQQVDELETPDVDAPKHNSFRAAQEANAQYRKDRAESANVEFTYQLSRLRYALCDGPEHAFIRSADAALAEKVSHKVTKDTCDSLGRVIQDLTKYLVKFKAKLGVASGDGSRAEPAVEPAKND